MSRTALHIELCIVFVCGVLFADAVALAAQPGRSLFKSSSRMSNSQSRSSNRQITRSTSPKKSAVSSAKSFTRTPRTSNKGYATKSQPVTRKTAVNSSSKQSFNKSRTGSFGSNVIRRGSIQPSKKPAIGSTVTKPRQGRSFSQPQKGAIAGSKVTNPGRTTVAGPRTSIGKNPALQSAISRKGSGAKQSGRGTVDASKLKKDFVSKGSPTSTRTPVTKNLTDQLQSNIAKQRGGSTVLPIGKGQNGSKGLPTTDSAADAARDAITGSGRFTRGGSGGNMNAQFIPGFDEAAEATENAVGWLNDKAEEAANQAGKVIGDAANQAGRVAEDVANQAGRVAEDVADQAGRVAEDAAEQAGRIVGDVADETGRVVEDVSDEASRVVGELSDQFKDVIGDVADDVDQGRETAEDFVDDFLNDVIGGDNNEPGRDDEEKPADDPQETGRDSTFPVIDRGDFLPGFPFPQDGDDERPADEPVDNNDPVEDDADRPEQDYPEQGNPEQDEAPYDDYDEYEEQDEYYEEVPPYQEGPSVTDLLIDLGNRLGAMPIGGGGGFVGGGVVEGPVVEPIVEPLPAEPHVAQLPDLLVEDVRFVDAGDEQGQLGPRYRITLRNAGDAPVGEFGVTLAAGIDFEDADQIAHSEAMVSGLAAGEQTTLDIRLPIDALGLALDQQGRPVPFVLLLVAIDFDEQVVEQTRENNRLLLDRREIMPIDFAAPQPTNTTAAN